MFINNINPIIFSIGSISIRYYGLVYALGFLLTYIYLRKLIKNKKINLNFEELDSLIIYLILGVVIGGRLGEFIFFRPTEIITKPLEIFMIWHGGMSFHGGLLGVLVALKLFVKKYNKKFFEIIDILVIPLSLVLVFGRIANFINSELVGTITKVPWGVNFNNEINQLGERIYRHPSQIYEAIKNLIIFLSLIIIKYKRKIQEGTLTWWFILLYGFGRLITDIWRADNHWLFNILSTGQILSLIMIPFAMYFLIKKNNKNNKNNNKNKKNNSKKHMKTKIKTKNK